MTKPWSCSILGLFLLAALACTERVPLGPSGPPGPAARVEPGGGGGLPASPSLTASANRPPVLVYRTTPRADTKTSPFPTISGLAPLTVRFNLCHSFDPDPEDQLNWQFNFGDGKVLSEDPTSGWDFGHFCRVEHTYREGCYVATLSVTDRHLEDQSGGAVAFGEATIMARTVQPLTITAGAQCGPPEPAAPAPSVSFLIVFATSTLHQGSLGGLAGGDAICQARAAAAGLTGTFMAWLSAAAGSPSTRFTQSSVPYRLVNGTQVADNWVDLTDGTLDAPINRTETGAFIIDYAWTGTLPSGTALPDAEFDRCQNWTDGTNDRGGRIGSAAASNAWTNTPPSVPCNIASRLYCFQQ